MITTTRPPNIILVARIFITVRVCTVTDILAKHERGSVTIIAVIVVAMPPVCGVGIRVEGLGLQNPKPKPL